MPRLTKKQILKEVVKCGKDPSYFLKNYARISHPMHGLMLFKTYDYQDVLLNEFNDYRFNIINKGRQLGISTITAGYIVWMMLLLEIFVVDYECDLLSLLLVRESESERCFATPCQDMLCCLNQVF